MVVLHQSHGRVASPSCQAVFVAAVQRDHLLGVLAELVGPYGQFVSTVVLSQQPFQLLDYPVG